MLGIRLDPKLERDLVAIARRLGRTKSDVAREAIRRYLAADELALQARRQSLLISGDATEQDALEFIEHAADLGDEP